MVSHPDLELLLRCAGGECRETERTAVEAHLEKCPACRRQSACLRSAFAPDPAGSAGDPGLDSVLQHIAQWRTLRAGRSSSLWSERVVEELSPYLGAAGAGEILRRVSDNGENLLNTLEPVLVLFLGKRAAADLLNRIVETSLVNA